jgi:arylsulfatase A-like enzyme
MPSKNRPNLIYLFADQLRYHSCGFAGDPYAHTPNIDRLAAESANCTNAISNTPVCAAYRASLFTGKHQSSHGMVINELRLSPDHECFGHVLTKAGYETSYIGKWHLWANELGHHRMVRNAFTPPGPYRLGFDGYWAGYNFSHNSYEGVYFEETCEPHRYEGYEADIQTDMAIDRISHHSESDKPFALFLSWGPPHDPWGTDNVKPEDWDRFKDTDIPTRPNFSLEQDAYADRWATMDDQYRDNLTDNVRGYYAQTANIDQNLGRILDAIDRSGLSDDTVLVFTSDHGEMFGSHGRRAKNIFYEEAAHVPFLIRKPGLIPAGEVETCISTVDLMPTLLRVLGLNPPETVEGVDLSSSFTGQSAIDNEILMQGMGTTAAWRDGSEWRGLRDGQYTYAVYRRDHSEHLYDNQIDAYQQVNLATDPGKKALLDSFRTRLDTRLIELEDQFEACTWYEDAWTQNRNIMRGARGGSHDLQLLDETIRTHFPDDALERSVDD